MKNTYLTPLGIEEVEHRKEFTSVDSLGSCIFNKCFTGPIEGPYIY